MEVAQEGVIMFKALSKAKTHIDDSIVYPCLATGFNTLAKKVHYLDSYIIIMGFLLHVSGQASHVHDDKRGLVLSHGSYHRCIKSSCCNVIYYMRSFF